MEVATVSGHAERLMHTLGWPVDEQTIAEMHALSTDPVVYGVELGNTLGKIEKEPDESVVPWWQLLADLYRACGADLEVAERQRVWRIAQRW